MTNPLGFTLLALLAANGTDNEDKKPSASDDKTTARGTGSSGGDSIDIRLLEILHESGRIDDAEFARLKNLSLNGFGPSGGGDSTATQAGTAPAGDSAAPKVKVEPGKGLTVESADGKYKLNAVIRLQLQYIYTDRDSNGARLNPNLYPTNRDSSTFLVRRARLIFRGHVWDPKITYFFNIQADEGTSIKDAWAGYEAFDGVTFRMGQQKTQFGKITTGSSGYLEFVERDLVSKQFADSRARGLIALGKHGEKDMFNWNAGVFNSDTAAGFPGAGEERSNPDNELNFTAGARFDPQGDLGGESYREGDLEHSEFHSSFGGGVWVGNESVNNVSGGADISILSFNVNAAIKADGWHGIVELYMREDDVSGGGNPTINSWGWVGQGSYTLEPDTKGHQLGFAGRIAQGHLKDNIPAAYGTGGTAYLFGPVGGAEGHFTELTAGINQYYHGHALKSQLDFTYLRTDWQSQAFHDRDDFIVRFQFTINT